MIQTIDTPYRGLEGAAGVLAEMENLCKKCLRRSCNNPRDGRGSYCREHRQANLASGKRSRDRKQAEGICIHCTRPVVPGLVSCERHRKKGATQRDRTTDHVPIVHLVEFLPKLATIHPTSVRRVERSENLEIAIDEPDAFERYQQLHARREAGHGPQGNDH